MDDGSRNVLNWDRLNDVTEGDSAFARELIGVYVRDSATLIDELESALACMDVDSVTKAAHTLKGASASIGADELSGIAASLEMALKAQPMAVAQALMPALGQAFVRLQAELQAFMNRLQS